MTKHIISFLALCFISFGGALPGKAAAQDDIGGTIQVRRGDKIIYFPVLKTDIAADIQGDLAIVKITQTFANHSTVPLNATYLFPLNKDAAIYAMKMEIGDEVIEAVIKRKEQAQAIFNKAKEGGKAASLLIQHRPNMFTQEIANLMPGAAIKVTLHYTQAVPKTDGAYELVVPLIVGPRYQSVGAGQAPDIIDAGKIDDGKSHGQQKSTSRSDFGMWELETLPDAPPVANIDIPQTIEEDRVAIKVTIDADMPIQSVSSATHALSIQGTERQKTISLEKGRVIDNRDFVLRYRLDGTKTQAGFLATREDGEGYFSLLIEPPALPGEADITPREMVFVLDTSGSMNGEPLEASKAFMRHALQNLKSGDAFRIINFSNRATEFRSQPVSATPDNIREGLDYVDQLQANGGTEVPSAITQAFSVDPQPGVLRIVVFLTDGYIGNGASVLQQISAQKGDARIYAFGVGSSVNRYLLSEMGHRGRGFARFIDPTEKFHDAAISFAAQLDAPVLTDISVDWGTLKINGTTPDIIPDLFAGGSIRLQGKFKGSGKHVIHIQGKIKGKAASLPVEITLPDGESGKFDRGHAIPLIWARSRIADMMRGLTTPGQHALSKDELKAEVTRLGLKFSIMSRWTSFVAVSKKIVNNTPQLAKDRHVIQPMVKGVTQRAYGKRFSGGSVPEPSALGGLILLGLVGLFAVRRKGRKA